MGNCRRLVGASLVVAVCAALAGRSGGHEPTLPRFQRERALAVAQVLQAAEPAPRAGGAEGAKHA